MRNVIIFLFLLSLLALVSMISQEEEGSVIAVQAMYDPSNPPGFGRMAHTTLFRHFLQARLAEMEKQASLGTKWQEGKIQVNIWIVSQKPFWLSVVVTHEGTPFYQGLMPMWRTTDAAAAEAAANAIGLAIEAHAFVCPMSQRPRQNLAQLLAPRNIFHDVRGAQHFYPIIFLPNFSKTFTPMQSNGIFWLIVKNS